MLNELSQQIINNIKQKWQYKLNNTNNEAKYGYIAQSYFRAKF